MYIYIYIHTIHTTHTHIYIYICMHVCMYVCMYVCMCVYTSLVYYLFFNGIIYIYISNLVLGPVQFFFIVTFFTTITFYLLNLCNVLQLSLEGVLLFVVQVFGGSVWPLRR